MQVQRLRPGDRELVRAMLALLAEVFEEDVDALSDDYVDRLLGRDDFWAIAAIAGDKVVGGLTAHSLPMTRSASAEIMIYDLAVHPSYQRQGVGRRLITELQVQAAAIGVHELFVAADNDDLHALDFYRALGGTPAPVTIFSFTPPGA